MYIFGVLFYLFVPLGMLYFDISAEFLNSTWTLAPEITGMIFVTYCYPLIIFFLILIKQQKRMANISTHFKSQVDLAATLTVSFGLIGTFIGLAEMIGLISQGMGATGDFAVKMESLLTSISGALKSMSFAFLTSILGIGASTTILIGANFIGRYFDDENEDKDKAHGKGLNFQGNDAVIRIEETLKESLDLVAGKEKVWSDLYLLLENNSGSKVVDTLNRVIQQNSHLISDVAKEIQGMRQDHSELFAESNNNTAKYNNEFIEVIQAMRQNQNELFAESNNNTVKYSEKVTGVVSSAIDSLVNMQMAIDALRDNADANSESISNVISENISKLDSVSSVLQSLAVALAPPIHELLDDAINNDLFDLYFQPQENHEGQFVGAETFVHWEDPVRGKITNMELFAEAEKHHLIDKLDKWIMNSAFKTLSGWVQNNTWNADSTLSINVSASYFFSPVFTLNLESMLKEYSILPNYIALEITENILMSQPELCRDKIRQLRNLGVKIYIDEFGTGFTSMKNIRSLHIDMLKIDRTIITEVLNNAEEEESIVRSIVSMASELKISVAVLGIESQDQKDKLLLIGCDIFQGYFIGRPVETLEFKTKYMITNNDES